jgi:hypothetical protein
VTLDALIRCAHAARHELALACGVVWLWIAPVFTPAVLDPIAHVLNPLASILMFALLCIRILRVLFGGDPPRPDIGASR